MAEIVHVSIGYEVKLIGVMAKFEENEPARHFNFHFGAEYAPADEEVDPAVRNLILQLESALTKVVTDRVRRWVDDSETWDP